MACDDHRSENAGREPALLARAGRGGAASRRHDQHQLRRARRRRAVRGPDRRRHPGPSGDALQRARGVDCGACRRAVAGGDPCRAGGAGDALRRRTDARARGRPPARDAAPRRRPRAPLPPRGAEAPARPGADLLALSRAARLRRDARGGAEPVAAGAAAALRAADRAFEARARPDRDRVRPQRPPALEPHRRRRAAVADRLGLCRLLDPALRPRQPRHQQRARARGRADAPSLYFGAEPEAGLARRFAGMRCVSLLRETLWSMAAEIHSTLDFDAPAYTARQLARFEEALRRLEKTA